MDFRSDVVRGKEGEDDALKATKALFLALSNIDLMQAGETILVELDGSTFEVKLHDSAAKYGNVFIETGRKNAKTGELEKSGLNVSTADYQIHIIPGYAIVILTTERMRRVMNAWVKKNPKSFKGASGDGKRTSGIAIPCEELTRTEKNGGVA